MGQMGRPACALAAARFLAYRHPTPARVVRHSAATRAAAEMPPSPAALLQWSCLPSLGCLRLGAWNSWLPSSCRIQVAAWDVFWKGRSSITRAPCSQPWGGP